MDLYDTIQHLYSEKERLERVISSLEALLGIGQVDPKKLKASKRGRKSMGVKEREEVSARMKSYWDQRRRDSEKK